MVVIIASFSACHFVGMKVSAATLTPSPQNNNRVRGWRGFSDKKTFLNFDIAKRGENFLQHLCGDVFMLLLMIGLHHKTSTCHLIQFAVRLP